MPGFPFELYVGLTAERTTWLALRPALFHSRGDGGGHLPGPRCPRGWRCLPDLPFAPGCRLRARPERFALPTLPRSVTFRFSYVASFDLLFIHRLWVRGQVSGPIAGGSSVHAGRLLPCRISARRGAERSQPGDCLAGARLTDRLTPGRRCLRSRSCSCCSEADCCCPDCRSPPGRCALPVPRLGAEPGLDFGLSWFSCFVWFFVCVCVSQRENAGGPVVSRHVIRRGHRPGSGCGLPPLETSVPRPLLLLVPVPGIPPVPSGAMRSSSSSTLSRISVCRLFVSVRDLPITNLSLTDRPQNSKAPGTVKIICYG